MRRFLAIALCLVMVSAFAVTAVSAKQASTSGVRQYDVLAGRNNLVIGKLSVDFTNGHYVVNANWAKAGYKGDIKQLAGTITHVSATNAGATPPSIAFGSVSVNNGGNAHGEGTLDQATLNWLSTYGDGATFYIG